MTAFKNNFAASGAIPVDALYLFACRTSALREQSLAAARELAKSLDDARPEIRTIAESFLHDVTQQFAITSIQRRSK